MEKYRLYITKFLVRLLPRNMRYRIAKLLYSFDSPLIKGIDMVIDYFPASYRLKLKINTKDYIGWNIYFRGEYEEDTNAILAEYVKPGMTVVEAGANHGSETVIIAHLVGRQGHVYAFEPIEKMVKKLEANIDLNNQSTWTSVEPFALGNETKPIEFYLPNDEESNQGMGSKFQINIASTITTVQQITLDNWAKEKNLQNIDFIKIDIQGAELDMLLGSEVVLSTLRPILYLEADEIQSANGNSNLENLYLKLRQHQYQIFNITPTSKTALASVDNLIAGNWLALPE